ncbi:hypothetical protein V5G24_23010 [Xanthobacter sp. VTT E-85241]|uniref:hypothetical protein n=1 Tax=Roseixanthobacter finlandensis TaxID=3119922 RepID=UPI0037279AD7
MDWGVTLHGLLPQELDAFWPQFWGLLSKANEADPAAQIEEGATYLALAAGQVAGFYALDDGHLNMALTVEVKETSRGRVAEVTAIGGVDMPRWIKGIDLIEAWAKSIGCEYLQASGRSGWERVLKDRGFRKVAITVEKAL